MPIVKEFISFIVTSVLQYLIISCVFLLQTEMYAKHVECRYNHNVKMSVITLGFIMNNVSSGQPGKFHINVLFHSPCSISYRGLHLYRLFLCLFASSPHGITIKIIASSFTYAV